MGLLSADYTAIRYHRQHGQVDRSFPSKKAGSFPHSAHEKAITSLPQA